MIEHGAHPLDELATRLAGLRLRLLQIANHVSTRFCLSACSIDSQASASGLSTLTSLLCCRTPRPATVPSIRSHTAGRLVGVGWARSGVSPYCRCNASVTASQ